jgi:hypothetical protein
MGLPQGHCGFEEDLRELKLDEMYFNVSDDSKYFILLF